MSRSLIWFTRDLRLDDNQALNRAAAADALTCVFCIDPDWFRPRRYHTAQMNRNRWQFLHESIAELKDRLSTLGQALHIVYGNPVREIASLIGEHAIDEVVVSRLFGTDEQRQWQALEEHYDNVSFIQIDNTTLFDKGQLGSVIAELPCSFSKFRKQVSQIKVPDPQAIRRLPPPIDRIGSQAEPPEWIPDAASDQPVFVGGESKGYVHVQQYFATPYPASYKQSRNALDDWYASAKVSPWLNTGCLSVRRLKRLLDYYEQQHGKNEGTDWLCVELLWREYFQWLAEVLGPKLFSFKGLANTAPLTSFYAERFRQWTEGNTPFPIVNACMRQLKQTGYISNRCRLIAASALVNELSVDWRYGAAWYEHCLLDYDVAVNWGNWQYLAGVGTDSRGGRHFNLNKQTAIFDTDGNFRKRWAPGNTPESVDTLDAAGWPINPDKLT